MGLKTNATALVYDDRYEALLSAHRGLGEAESHALNARLVLLLANHISDIDVLREAFEMARNDAPAASQETGDSPPIPFAQRMQSI